MSKPKSHSESRPVAKSPRKTLPLSLSKAKANTERPLKAGAKPIKRSSQQSAKSSAKRTGGKGRTTGKAGSTKVDRRGAASVGAELLLRLRDLTTQLAEAKAKIAELEGW